MFAAHNSSRFHPDSEYDFPDPIPSILEHYQKLLPSPLTNLSPGNAAARHFSNKTFSENIRRSVVSVSSFQGVKRKIDCSGIIIHWDKHGSGVVLTSAVVLRFPQNACKRHYNVIVRLFSGELLVAKEWHVDFRMNIAILMVSSAQPLQAIELKTFDSLRNGLEICVLGRDFLNISLLQGKGVVLTHPPCFGCDELLSSTCQADMKCNGGPVVTGSGDIVGVAFVDGERYSHILPSRSILLLLDFNYRIVHPWSGITVIDKDKLSLDVWDLLNVSSSDDRQLFVKEVYPGSCADKLQIRPGDSVISFNGHCIGSVEEYCNLVQHVSSVMSVVGSTNNPNLHSVKMLIRRRVDHEVVNVDCDILMSDDTRFCVCWRFNQDLWRTGNGLPGSQTERLRIEWSPMMISCQRNAVTDSSETIEEE